jgi:general L-amino acid transport system permease protein
MTTWYQNLQERVGGEREVVFDFSQFVHENITRSWPLFLWVLLLTYLTIRVTLNQLDETPITTLIVLGVWLVTVGMTVYNEITRHHSSQTLWLRNNLYSSITNVELTLILTLLIIAAVRGFIGYAFVRASFTTDPELAAANLAQYANPGANWGAVIDNMRNLMVFRYPREETWRIWATIVYLFGLLGVSTYVYSQERLRKSTIRRLMTVLWVLTPFITFVVLLGVGGENSPIPWLNPDIAWGGLLLTLIIAVFAILASFPLGVMLALGRRSDIRGIPAWLTYGVAVLLAGYFFFTSTTTSLEQADSLAGQIFAFWPVLILVAAYLFQKYFDGNVVAASSTLYIEVVRGVPLITVLFMSIILFPILLPSGLEILSTWRVMAAAALFAAAYLAENVRGGLQSIPNGQYEAADALGLNTFQKYRLIIMPQALRAVIPAIVGQFIGLFKDTTLIAIVGLVELLGVANLITAQPDWLGVRREPYIFLMVIYFAGSWVMATSSRRMEQNLGVGER